MPFIDHIPPIKKRCDDPEHSPPSGMVLEPGTHTWQCPSCGDIKKLHVPEVTM